MTPDIAEVPLSAARERLEGWVPELATEQELFDALERAFDYRGDVTITRKDGSTIEGYIFDRRAGKSLSDSVVRLFPKGPEMTKLSVSYDDIAAVAFTGRDTAAGKSWEAWVRKYWEKKKAGETDIQIQPEQLD
jgi:hypothetical protein